jgi:2,4-didehydro-3-deoxy-L-rhamnonate hydrolase
MKFVTFVEQGQERAGVLTGGGDAIIDLAHPAMRDALTAPSPAMLDLVEAGLPRLIERLHAHGLAAEATLPCSAVSLRAPLPAPRRIYGVAFNYRDALAERGMAPPANPVLFMKAPHTVISTDEAIVLPPGIGGVTYEAELAAVIGSVADNVSTARALDHVAAYSCLNDISASEIIKADGHFDRGKNFPTFCPFGPYLASSDEIPDPHALKVSLQIDGHQLQQGSTRDMLFGVAELISCLSHRQPLKPGDIIATGTPAGVAVSHKPPAWLRPGAVVEMEVEGLGRLRNPVVEGPQDA